MPQGPDVSPDLNKEFDPAYGQAIELLDAPLVRRITAPNPSPYTFTGTNSYLVGWESVGIIDPGPDDEKHLTAIVEAVAETGFASHIILTHHHPDHVDGVERLKHALGVPVFGTTQCVANGVAVDVVLYDGDEVNGDDWTLEAYHTPGHTADHLCFGLMGTDVLFSGDHVMGWSTSVIIPPDGNLNDYLSSLEQIADRSEFQTYLPGHGGELENGPRFAQAMRRHRLMRSAQIMKAVEGARARGGAIDRAALLEALYPEIDASLKGAAAQSLEAHLISLCESKSLREQSGLFSLF